MRSSEQGWKRIGRWCSSKRRALWARIAYGAPNVHALRASGLPGFVVNLKRERLLSGPFADATRDLFSEVSHG